MKKIYFSLLCLSLSLAIADSSNIENNVSAVKAPMPFQAKKIVKMTDEERIRAEEKKEEEDGFCACSVQRP